MEHLEQFPIDFNDDHITAGQISLDLIGTALNNSSNFMNCCREAGAGLLLTPTHQLLRAINIRTNKADHVLNITKLVRHASSQPGLAFSALKILRFLGSKFSDHELLSLTVTGSTTQRDEILRGFWECIELNDQEAEDCRIELLKLLLQGVDSVSVSLSHFLLGYPLQASLTSASLQDAGVLNSPKTVLHSLLDLLQDKTICLESPVMVETFSLKELQENDSLYFFYFKA